MYVCMYVICMWAWPVTTIKNLRERERERERENVITIALSSKPVSSMYTVK